MSLLFSLSAVATIGVWTLEATAFLVGAWLMTRRLQQSAAQRHLIWLVAFCVLLIIPALTLCVPARFVIHASVLTGRPASAIRLAADGIPAHRQPGGIPIAAHTETGTTTAISLAAHETARSTLCGRDWRSIAIVLIGVWMLGAGVVILQGAVAFHRLAVLHRRSAEFAPGSLDLTGLTPRAWLRRAWRLRISAMASPPAAMTWGLLCPIVLLPRDADSWRASRLEAVLLHELAHVRRGDSLGQLVALIVCAIYWFHPLVWLCARAMRTEAETAADDIVLLSGVKPSAYAAELIGIAAQLGAQRQPLAGLEVSIMRRSRIESRIRSIVDPSVRRCGTSAVGVMKATVSGVGAMLLLAAVRPCVSFADAPNVATVEIRACPRSHLPSTGSAGCPTPGNPAPRPTEVPPAANSAWPGMALKYAAKHSASYSARYRAKYGAKYSAKHGD